MRKKYPKNYLATAGEWIPHKRKMEWQCCDCGLVHDVHFKILRGEIWVKMFINKKETAKARKKV